MGNDTVALRALEHGAATADRDIRYDSLVKEEKV